MGNNDKLSFVDKIIFVILISFMILLGAASYMYWKSPIIVPPVRYVYNQGYSNVGYKERMYTYDCQLYALSMMCFPTEVFTVETDYGSITISELDSLINKLVEFRNRLDQ